MTGRPDAPTDTGTLLPDGLVLGAATSAYQVEGAADRRGASIWDTFCRLPGAVARGESGERACDHVRRVDEDVSLMTGLGLQGYRLSLSWPRILPTGRGAVSTEGLGFYTALLTRLKDAGLETVVTLYHWDLPQALEDEGGWRSRATVEAFADYAEVAARHLGHLVDRWVPVNEPHCVAWTGHLTGEHAPGLRDLRATFRVAHHLNLAHALAVQRLRRHAPGAVGTALNLISNLPYAADAAHARAARLADLVLNEIWLGPLVDGAYDPELLALAEPYGGFDAIRDGDLDTARELLDFVGVNYYGPGYVAPLPEPRGPVAPATRGEWWPATLVGSVDPPPQDPHNALGWWVHPPGLSRLLRRTHERTGLPLLVTENGTCTIDESLERSLDDVDRVRYLHDHLEQVAAVAADGVPVHGYYAWSLLDNFEWAFGYAPRFGLVHVDAETGERTPKRSAHWYADVIRTRRLPVERPDYRDFVARGSGAG